MTRREFLVAAGAAPFLFTRPVCGAAAGRTASEAAATKQWFRGQLHMHSYWSDGNAFPEQAIDMYRQAGYHFLALTEHNVFADNPSVWRQVAASTVAGSKIAQARFDDYVAAFGQEVDRKDEAGVTYVRLKTYAEVKARFDAPGVFLVMPGQEITQTITAPGLHPAGGQLHMNAINIPAALPTAVPTGYTTTDMIGCNAALAAASGVTPQRYTLTVNHPFWVFCDIVPQNLIDRPEIRFFEVCNGGSSYSLPAGAENYTCEKFWDSVNAFRRIRRKPLLFGFGTDDAHNYQPPAMNSADGFGSAWVEVLSEELSAPAVVQALYAGDFYASCGVQLEQAAFSLTDKTLRVKVRAVEGVAYRIHFITTKRGFNQAVTYVNSPASGSQPARTIPIYSDDVGRTVKSVDGTEASYTLADDDLYVRARVESSLPAKFVRNFYPQVQTAWTQPFAVEEPASGPGPVSEAESGASALLRTQAWVDQRALDSTALSLGGYAAACSAPATILQKAVGTIALCK